MTLRVEHVSGVATVQDLGRPGHAHIGVPTSGAADPLSLRLVNLAVDNDGNAPGLEVAAGSVTLLAQRACMVSVSADEHAFEAIELAQGQTIELRPGTGLCRAYLAVAGGIDVAPVLGSCSTLRSAGFGGLQGRSVVEGDVLPVVGPARQPARAIPSYAVAMARFAVRRRVLRVVTDGAEALLPAGLVRVSARSDRVGVRLERSAPSAAPQPLAHSRGVIHGTIQMPSSSELVILGPDGPTTGGYPTVGTVIAADLPAVGQLTPGQWVRLEAVPLEEARELLWVQSEVVARIH